MGTEGRRGACERHSDECKRGPWVSGGQGGRGAAERGGSSGEKRLRGNVGGGTGKRAPRGGRAIRRAKGARRAKGKRGREERKSAKANFIPLIHRVDLR